MINMTNIPPIETTNSNTTSVIYHPTYIPINRNNFIVTGTFDTTTSLTYVMLGLKQQLRVNYTGEIFFHIVASGYNSIQAAGIQAQMCYGTGDMPNSGDAPTGTLIGNFTQHTSSNANAYGSLTMVGYVLGLIRGINYWFDVQWKVISSGTASMGDISGYISEVV